MGDAACWAHVVCPACGRVTPEAGPRPQIVLVGSMGAGKTTVGRRVADRLDWRFVDNDDLFARRTGTTPSGFAAEHGDDAMHRMEWELLAEALAAPGGTVVAAPGSVGDAPSPDLDDALVVWLEVEADVVARRVRAGDHRPLLGDEPSVVLSRLLDERAGRYAELADLTVAATDASPDEVTGEVVAAWCRHAGHV